MKKKNYKKKIKLGEGRPKRVWIINHHDILAIRLAIETAKTFDEFLEMI